MKEIAERDDFLDRDFNFDKAVKNAYAKELKKQMTIKVSPSTIAYFKKEAARTGIPYQTLINLYLDDCVKENRKIDISWNKAR